MRSTEFGITSFVYRARRPFHPDRLDALVANDALTAGLLRSKGFAWIATRSQWVALWSQAGRVMELSPQGVWWADVPRNEWPDAPDEQAELLSHFEGKFGDRRQELVFIGTSLDAPALRAALDAALLTDVEMAGGPDDWARLTDPLPPWSLPVTSEALQER